MNLYLVNKGPLIGSNVISPSVRLSQHGPTAANPLLQVVGPGGMRYRSIAATAADECVVSRCQHMYTVSQKSEPPKYFATAIANLHRFKWNFTHTRRRLFLSLTSNFIRIRYPVYEIFNSFKLLSQISVTDTTSSLRPLPDRWRRPSERTIDWRVASFWSEHYWQSSASVAWSTA